MRCLIMRVHRPRCERSDPARQTNHHDCYHHVKLQMPEAFVMLINASMGASC
jgi:hypothetical protein